MDDVRGGQPCLEEVRRAVARCVVYDDDPWSLRQLFQALQRAGEFVHPVVGQQDDADRAAGAHDESTVVAFTGSAPASRTAPGA